MTENNEPIAQAPEAAFTPAPTAPAAPRKRRPVLFAGAAAIALAAGLGGYAAGDHGSVDQIHQVSDNRGLGQPGMMGNGQQGLGNGQQGMGPHCEDTSRNHAPVNADGTCPDGFKLDQGQPGMMGNSQQGMMGPHCEDASHNHAPVNADGTCPTGFTLDDRGGAQLPNPTASTGTQG